MSKILAGCAIKCNRILSILHAAGLDLPLCNRIISFACSQLEDCCDPLARPGFLSADAPGCVCRVSLPCVTGRDHHD